MKKTAFIFSCSLFFVACNPSKKDIITKKWQAVSVESDEVNQSIEQSKVFFDTVGKSTDAATNKALYGVENMDSMREVLKMQLEEFIENQKRTVKNTWLDFRKDSILIASFGTGPDTVKWYFDDEGNLMMDELAQKGTGSIIKMNVLKLEDTVLQLQFKENDFSSIATFRPE